MRRWEQFYKTENYKKYFDIFPPILIISTNIDKVKDDIDSIKQIELNYSYKNYKDIKNWKYKY